MFCQLTDRHLERLVFLGTLSRSQDQVLLQNDATTETCRLWSPQKSLQTNTMTRSNNDLSLFGPHIVSWCSPTCQGHSEDEQLSPSKLLRTLLETLSFHCLRLYTLPQG